MNSKHLKDIFIDNYRQYSILLHLSRDQAEPKPYNPVVIH